MSTVTATESNAAKAVVRRNTEEVQGKGGFNVFDELFAEDFVDHNNPSRNDAWQGGCTKALHLYACCLSRFPC